MANKFLNGIDTTSLSVNSQYSLPTNDGSNKQVLTTDGNGNVTFSDVDLVGAQAHYVYYEVKNSTGATIPKGTAVRAVGTDGNSGHILVSAMVADGSVEPRYFIGITSDAIGNGQTGEVIHFGMLTGFDTSGFSDGDVLWCDPASDGNFTTTEPAGPNLKLAVAFVVNAANNGKIFIRVQGNEGLHELHDVNISSQADGDLLQWNATSGVWENKTLASIADSRYVNVSGDTMTGLLTFRGSTSANNFLQRLGAGGGSGNYSTLDIVKIADTDGDFMFMAYHAGIGNTTSSPKIIFGHYSPTPTDGHVLTIDTKDERVGIRNSSPSQALDVSGNIQSSGYIKSGYDGTGTTSAFEASGDPFWYMYGFGARGASAGAYGIGLKDDIADRTLSIHVPNHAAYGSTGSIPKIGFYSNGSVELFTVQSNTGNTYIKGSVTAGSIVKSGGTSSQFLKADGSVDSNTYLTSEADTLQSVTDRGASSDNTITLSGSGTDRLYLNVNSTEDSSDQNAIRYLVDNSLKAQVGVAIDANRIISPSSADDYIIKSWGNVRIGNENGATNLFITNAGDVSLPDGNLTVNGTVQADQFYSLANTDVSGKTADWMYVGLGSGAGGVIVNDVDGARYAISAGDHDLTFAKHISTGSTWSNVMRFESTGADNDANVRVFNDFTANGQIYSDRRGVFNSDPDENNRVLTLRDLAANNGNIVQFEKADASLLWEIVGRENGFYIYNNMISTMAFHINETTNNIGIGGPIDQANRVSIQGTNDYLINLNNTSNDPRLQFQKQGTSLGHFSAGTGLFTMYGNSGTSLRFMPNGTTAMYMNTDGDIGVGTTSPTSYGAAARTLEVRGQSGSGSGLLRVSNADNTVGTALYSSSGSGTLNVQTNHPLTFATNNSEKMRLTSSGNLGLLTQSPESPLDINTGTANAQADWSGGTIAYGTEKADLILTRRHSSTKHANLGYAGALIDFRATNSANEWSTAQIVSTIDPNGGSNHAGGLHFLTSGGGTTDADGRRNAGAAPSVRMSIDTQGRVGIAKVNPSHTLDIGGTLKVAAATNSIRFDADSIYTGLYADGVLRIRQRIEVWGGGVAGRHYLDIRDPNGNQNIKLNGEGDSFFANNLAVGTTSAAKGKLDVKNNIVFDSKNVSLNNSFADALTVSLSNHQGVYVKITVHGDWGSHSAVGYVAEFFLQNGANSYMEPGTIIRQDANIYNDSIEAQIVDPTGVGNPRDFKIQLKTTSATGTPFASLMTYEVRGVFNSVS